jgi:hypothetical protein
MSESLWRLENVEPAARQVSRRCWLRISIADGARSSRRFSLTASN